MKILFLGDIVAKSGRKVVVDNLPSLKEKYQADFVIVNGENAAHGKGITTKIYDSLKHAGADVITLGNHAFSKNEILMRMAECPDMIRPDNMIPFDVGHSYILKKVKNKTIAVVNLLGSIFMDVCQANPIQSMEDILSDIKADIIFVDFHAEATSEKQIFYHYFRQRITAVVGTHTHVQTADEQVTDGCAYISDVGMCGVFDSILGRDADEVIRRNVYGEKTHYTPADGPAMMSGVLIDIDDDTNRAVGIERIQIRPKF